MEKGLAKPCVTDWSQLPGGEQVPTLHMHAPRGRVPPEDWHLAHPAHPLALLRPRDRIPYDCGRKHAGCGPSSAFP